MLFLFLWNLLEFNLEKSFTVLRMSLASPASLSYC